MWNVGDDHDRDPGATTLTTAHQHVTYALEDRHGPDIPTQHSPWAPHICAAYSDDPGLLAALEDGLGLITFDRIRLAFAGQYTDIPLGPQEEPLEPEEINADGMATWAWSTPDRRAAAESSSVPPCTRTNGGCPSCMTSCQVSISTFASSESAGSFRATVTRGRKRPSLNVVRSSSGRRRFSRAMTRGASTRIRICQA